MSPKNNKIQTSHCQSCTSLPVSDLQFHRASIRPVSPCHRASIRPAHHWANNRCKRASSRLQCIYHTTTCRADHSLGTLHRILVCTQSRLLSGASPLRLATDLAHICPVDNIQGKSDSHSQNNCWPNLPCQMIEDKLQSLTLQCLVEHTTHIHTQLRTNYDQGRAFHPEPWRQWSCTYLSRVLGIL